MLTIFEYPPAGLWDCDATDLAEALGGPALIRIPGECVQPLFVSTLLHGNETTGWNALRQMMRRQGDALPRAITLLIGNVHAASEGLRQLDGQPDYNRIWRDHVGPEAELAAHVLAEITRDQPIACVDLHNTSGENPVYGCVHRLDDPSRNLAGHFSDTLVLVRHPESLLTMALGELAPAATVECGKPGNEAVTRRISERLAQLLRDTELALRAPAPGKQRRARVMRSTARVRVPDEVNFTIGGNTGDLQLVTELERYNFCTLAEGTLIATVRRGSGARLHAVNDNGDDVTGQYFRIDGERLVTRGAVMPSMFTPDERIVRQDCLCYLMEPVSRTEAR